MGIGTSADGSSSLSLLAAVRKFVAAGCVVAPPPGADGTPMIFDDSCDVFFLCVFGRLKSLREYFCEEYFFFGFLFFLVEEEEI